MRTLLLITAILFSFQVHANSCVDGKLAALEKGKIEAGATNPVSGSNLNSFQAERNEIAKGRLEAGLKRTLTNEDSIAATAYSDLYRNSANPKTLKEYEDYLRGRGFTDKDFELLRTRIVDPTFNGSSTSQQRAAQDPSARKIEQYQTARATSTNRYFQNPDYNPTFVGTGLNDLAGYARQKGLTVGNGAGANFKPTAFQGAMEYAKDVLSELSKAREALEKAFSQKANAAGVKSLENQIENDIARLELKVAELRRTCTGIKGVFEGLGFASGEVRTTIDRAGGCN